DVELPGHGRRRDERGLGRAGALQVLPEEELHEEDVVALVGLPRADLARDVVDVLHGRVAEVKGLAEPEQVGHRRSPSLPKSAAAARTAALSCEYPCRDGRATQRPTMSCLPLSAKSGRGFPRRFA